MPGPLGAVPHRGSLILTLGILGVSMHILGMGGMLFAPCCGLSLVGMGLGIPAWVMGRTDLRQMAQGIMDSSGRGATQGGMVCGIVAVALTVVELVAMIALVVVVAVIGVAAAGARP